MKSPGKKNVAISSLFVTAVALMGYTSINAQEDPSDSPFTGPNYLYIQEYELSAGVVPNEAIAQAQEWVKGWRETGEDKSVRLFIHHTGPRFALYILMEPNSWQALEDGVNKFFAANPDFMATSFDWGTHSDNLLNEIPVE